MTNSIQTVLCFKAEWYEYLVYWRISFCSFFWISLHERIFSHWEVNFRIIYIICKCLIKFKVALGVSPQFFSIWTRVLNHNKYVEIKNFSKVDIKQNNDSTVILLIKFLVYQWDPRHLQGNRVVYIFIYTLYSCSI